MTGIIGGKSSQDLPAQGIAWFLSALLLVCLTGCSGDKEKPAPGPGIVAGSTRPDDDVLTVLGVTPPRTVDVAPASGLRIEVHEPKFDEHKTDSPEAAPPPKRASPLDY